MAEIKKNNFIDNDRLLHVNVLKYKKIVRRGKITLSTVSDILTAKTPYEKANVAKLMLGLKKKFFTKEELERMNIGTKFESVVRDAYAKQIGLEIFKPDTLILRENPIFAANPDGITSEGDLVEIKISSMPIPEKYHDDYSEISLGWYYQMQGYMYITGIHKCHFVMYSRESDKIYSRIIPYDEKRWMEEVYYKICEFHEEYVMKLLEMNDMITPQESYELLIKELEK